MKKNKIYININYRKITNFHTEYLIDDYYVTQYYLKTYSFAYDEYDYQIWRCVK